MAELWQMGALELAEKIRTGETSSREVLEAHLARVDEVNGALNAVVRLLADEARVAADAADAEVANGDDLPVLHGVPCTVKENIDLAGTPTTQGVIAFAEAIASKDAPTVARMRAAGAIPFARTNLPDFGLRVHTESQLHGLTVNPWNAHVTVGGSSGGEGAALASGMSPIGLGNDIGGSLRNPAHCCGVASVKPSAGVVPMATVIEPTEQLLSSQFMVVEGPMARRVADVRVGLEIVAGPDIRDPRSVPARLTDAAPGERMKVAVMADPPAGTTDPEVAAAIRDVAGKLADAGHEVVEAAPPEWERVVEMWAAILLADVRAQKELLTMVMGDAGVTMLDLFDENQPPTQLPDALLVHADRFRLMREWSEFFAEHPVLLAPVWSQPAFEHGADIEMGNDALTNCIRPVLPANLLGLPAAVTPAGMAGDLPVGVQVMGDRFTDLRCLTVAEEIESLVGTLTPIEPR